VPTGDGTGWHNAWGHALGNSSSRANGWHGPRLSDGDSAAVQTQSVFAEY
jgi:hypothetical protein